MRLSPIQTVISRCLQHRIYKINKVSNRVLKPVLKTQPGGVFLFFFGFLGTGFYWVFGGLLKYEWQVLNVIHKK